MFLLDTNVVSELRKNRPHAAVLDWMHSVEDANLFLSAVSIGEIQAGIELTREQDDEKAAELEAWLDLVSKSYGILPLDALIFRVWARLMHRKSTALFEDALIAATAKVHQLVVVTRNVSDFVHFDVKVLNPFKRP